MNKIAIIGGGIGGLTTARSRQFTISVQFRYKARAHHHK